MKALQTLFWLAVTLSGIYHSIQTMRRRGPGTMRLFWHLILAVLAFGGIFLVPLVLSNLPDRHPATFFVALFAGITLFMGGIITMAIKANRRASDPIVETEQRIARA